MTSLDKTYNPSQIEKTWYTFWEQSGFFKPDGSGIPYCIMIPPPNVTGSLHMGHAFQQTLMDILIRQARMQGRNTLWQVGTDHAGIATQMVVERQLLAEGSSKESLGRDKFIKKVWDWKNTSGGNITQQLRRMGASLDWSRERFTLDDGLSKAVIQVFVKLYEEDLIYRGKRLVNWDPVLQTAVSDLEVEQVEEEGSLWYIRYPLVDNSGHIVVATTRPETLLGDVAVAVHPTDPRYASLLGKLLRLPLTDRLIPIIADESVDPSFGTGCVKITPAHDFNDFAMGERHQLPKINIFTKIATLNDTVPQPYRGLDRFKARKKILADLTNDGLIEKIEKHRLSVPRGDRSEAILEPMLTDQWFVKVESLAKPAIDAVESGQIRFIPENWSKTYFEWMRNIQDWCISRQLWWGHRIPAWYDEQGNAYVGENENAVRSKYNLSPSLSLKQDEDVLDTWFSSALWPFSTLGWPEQTPELQTFYPSQVLVTGFDIIFFWVARMIMFGLKFTGKIPFHEVYIHGLIQDQNGQKMSKTKGNVIDPIDLIDGIDLESLITKRTSGLMQPQLAEQIAKHTRTQFPQGIPAHGTDALRFTYAALATTGRHIRFDLKRIEGYKHFCNKLWNAARYVLMQTENKDIEWQAPKTLTKVDHWIISRWQSAKQELLQHFRQYRFDLAASTLYEFIWNEYCDWYLELSKPLLNSDDPQQVLGTRYTLITLLEEILRAVHPIMPYITEEIWQRVAAILKIPGETIMLQPYPEGSETLTNKPVEDDIDWLKTIILAIRNIRGEVNISPAKTISLLLAAGEISDQQRVNEFQLLLTTLAKVNLMNWLQPNEDRPKSATALVGKLELLVPIDGLIDVKAEKQRLQKELEKLNIDKEKQEKMLSNQAFKDKAPKQFEELMLKNEQTLSTILVTKNTIELYSLNDEKSAAHNKPQHPKITPSS
jgi:valyl-tRNA synthetase